MTLTRFTQGEQVWVIGQGQGSRVVVSLNRDSIRDYHEMVLGDMD